VVGLHGKECYKNETYIVEEGCIIIVWGQAGQGVHIPCYSDATALLVGLKLLRETGDGIVVEKVYFYIKNANMRLCTTAVINQLCWFQQKWRISKDNGITRTT